MVTWLSLVDAGWNIVPNSIQLTVLFSDFLMLDKGPVIIYGQGERSQKLGAWKI